MTHQTTLKTEPNIGCVTNLHVRTCQLPRQKPHPVCCRERTSVAGDPVGCKREKVTAGSTLRPHHTKESASKKIQIVHHGHATTCETSVPRSRTILKRRNQIPAADRMTYSATIVATPSRAGAAVVRLSTASGSGSTEEPYSTPIFGGSHSTCPRVKGHSEGLATTKPTPHMCSLKRTARPSDPRERTQFPTQRTQSTYEDTPVCESASHE